MDKPYIICHMMASLDGRIDCAMTEQLKGVEEYYKTLDSFDAKTRVSGRVTAELEMAKPGKFSSRTFTKLNKESIFNAIQADGYEVIIDTHGTLLWDNYNGVQPLLIVTSENVSKEYLDYLKDNNISWISTGKDSIDLKRACEILRKDFSVQRMVVVGGGHINGAFLKEGLIDEVSILIGAGIDGRDGMCSVFDGLEKNSKVINLSLEVVKTFNSGSVWLKYKVC